jgi:hypothetical protein
MDDTHYNALETQTHFKFETFFEQAGKRSPESTILTASRGEAREVVREAS